MAVLNVHSNFDTPAHGFFAIALLLEFLGQLLLNPWVVVMVELVHPLTVVIVVLGQQLMLHPVMVVQG